MINRSQCPRRLAFAVFILLINLPAQRQQAQAGAISITTKPIQNITPRPETSNLNGYIQADLPWRAQINREFEIDLWLVPKDTDAGATPRHRDYKLPVTSLLFSPATVHMEKNEDVEFSPESTIIPFGERKTIRARIVNSKSGLVEISAFAQDWEPMQATVDVGFELSLKSTLNDAISSGSPSAFVIEFVNASGQAVPLGGPVAIVLSTRGALLRSGSQQWGETHLLDVNTGGRSSPLVEIKARSLNPVERFVETTVMINSGYTIATEIFRTRVIPPWWIPLLCSSAGAMSYTLYELTRRKQKGRALFRKVFAGVLSGGLAYLLIDWKVLGIRMDSTSLQGFFILGFLFSHIGVDLVLANIKKTSKNT